MNTDTNLMGETLAKQTALPEIPALQRFYWSLRRELWENRAIYFAPVAAAAVFLVGFLISLFHLPAKMRALAALSPALQRHTIAGPSEVAAGLIMGTAFIVGVFYALDTLYGERRDRSILFWKSLPVSDLTTVLAKVSIPLIVLPLFSFVVTVATQLIMLILSSAVLAGSGMEVGILWQQTNFLHVSLILFYHLITVHGLWYAPIYGWFLLISVVAPRAPFVWAFLPPFVIGVVEKMTFNTSHFYNLLVMRLLAGPPGPAPTAAGNMQMDPLLELIPARFFSLPQLWVGLAITAVLLAVTVRVRRYRGPI